MPSNICYLYGNDIRSYQCSCSTTKPRWNEEWLIIDFSVVCIATYLIKETWVNKSLPYRKVLRHEDLSYHHAFRFPQRILLIYLSHTGNCVTVHNFMLYNLMWEQENVLRKHSLHGEKQPRVYWSCSSIIMQDCTPLTPHP